MEDQRGTYYANVGELSKVAKAKQGKAEAKPKRTVGFASGNIILRLVR
jgi:hypothetical protein